MKLYSLKAFSISKPVFLAFISVPTLVGYCIGNGAAETRTGTQMGFWHYRQWLNVLCHSSVPFTFILFFLYILNE